MNFGKLGEKLGGWASQLDQQIASEAAKRAQGARVAGVRRNMTEIQNPGHQGVNAQRIYTEAKPSGVSLQEIADMLKTEQGRASAARQYGRKLNRGPAAMGQQGVMEAISQGIATNKVVRRGVLPVAVAGGGMMAGAGVTAGAQQLWALMDFMRTGSESQQRTEESPLISHSQVG
jgi:hypothetical protein